MKLLFRSLLAAALAAGVFAASRAGAQREVPPPAAGQSPAQVEEELREFVPSEEIPADSSVSFPSDI
jgi:hypothetical protein